MTTEIQFNLSFGLILIILIAAILIWHFIDVVWGDDTESDLGLCLNYHIKAKCDKLDIEKLMNQLQTRAEQWNGDVKMCFENGTLMNKFLEENPGGHFDITVPCPPFKPPQQEDESGK